MSEGDIELRLACMIAGLLAGWFLPAVLRINNIFAPRHFASLFKASLVSLEELNDAVFACLYELNYQDRRYYYERRVHLKKNKLLFCFIKLQAISGRTSLSEKQENQHRQLIRLFDLMMAYAQLRWRVIDHTIFGVCQKEIQGINISLKQCIALIYRRAEEIDFDTALTNLKQHIEELDDIFQHVIKISSKEPMVFLLFIAQLKLFVSALADCWESRHA